MTDPRIDEELRHHIQERTDRLVREGMDPDEARRAAEHAFGDLDQLREEVARIDHPRRTAPGRLLDALVSDARFAVRQLRRNPGYAAVAVLTLGLGIGASAAIFGLVKAVVLDPLPYPESERLVSLNERAPDGIPFSVSGPNYTDFRDQVGSLEHLTAVTYVEHTTHVEGRPLQVLAEVVTGDFFRLFGAAAALGRTFRPGAPGSVEDGVVVLSHAFWRDHSGSDPEVLGSGLLLDGRPYEVIGVMPEGWGPTPDVDVWHALSPLPASRNNHDLSVVGRVAGGTSLAAAQAELEAAAAALGERYPASNGGWGAKLTPLKEAVVGKERIRAGWVLLGAVGLLVLMACASVSNLLLARASGRGHEIGLRAALGAGRGRLVRQLLTESSVLALGGVALGLLLAWFFLPILQTLSPSDTPRLGDASANGPVVLFAAAVGALSTLLFGLAPIAHLAGSRPSLGGGRTVAGGGRAQTLRYALVAGQVALSLTLLSGAGALARSYLALQSTDPGLPIDRGVVVPLVLGSDRYDSEDERGLVRTRIEDALQTLPGVVAVGSSNVLPFSGMNTVVGVNVEGQPTTADQAPFVRWRAVSRGWLRAADLKPRAGRTFEVVDFDRNAEDVVVLTTSLAHMLFGGDDQAVGKRIAMGWDGRNYRRVVGVVDDMQDRAMTGGPAPLFFFPEPGALPWVNLLVRFEGDVPLASASAVREAIWSVDAGLPVPSVERLDQRYADSVADHGFNLLVIAVFAGVALTLSLLGIYGLVLFTVERRTREIGVRIALGAHPRRVVRLLLAGGIRPALLGVVAGVVLSRVLTRSLDGLLFQTDASAPAHVLVPALLMALASLAAVWIPAQRATRVEPRESLRAE